MLCPNCSKLANSCANKNCPRCSGAVLSSLNILCELCSKNENKCAACLKKLASQEFKPRGCGCGAHK